MFLGKIYTRTVFLSVYCLFFNKRSRFYVAHLTFFLLFLFSLLYFVESHIAVLLDSSYLNIPNHYFHSSAVTFRYIVPLLVDGHLRSSCFLLKAEWYAAPRVSFSVRWPWRALSEHLTVGHPPFRICHWIVLIPTSSFMTFPGEASTITFSVAKLVQAVFCKYQRLIPWIFSKTFCRLRTANKNFSGPRVK